MVFFNASQTIHRSRTQEGAHRTARRSFRKESIRRAMAVSGLTAGDLAYEGARRVLDEHERMLLTGADRDAFLDAVCSTHPNRPKNL
jgi:hypothetical protein